MRRKYNGPIVSPAFAKQDHVGIYGYHNVPVGVDL